LTTKSGNDMNTQTQLQSQAEAEIARLVEHARLRGEEDPYHGKRAWSRYNAAVQLEVTSDPQSPASGWTVTMHNVSMGGFAGWSKTAMQRHDTLYVREFTSAGDRPWLKAIVRHCTHGIRGYLIGAEFTDRIRPSDSTRSPR